jgi:hypothetical protein
VNKDGSGAIYVREYLSPQITSMMEGMSGMAQGMQEALGGQEAGEGVPGLKPGSMFKDAAESKLEQFGSEVKLVGAKEVQNDKGWKGYQAKYTFEDVTKVQVSVGSSDMGGEAEGGMGEEKESLYRFEFEPGDTPTLSILPIQPEEEEGEEEEETAETAEETAEIEMDLDGLEMSEEMSGAMDAMGNQMMSGMMGPMLQGMRMRFFVQVDGDILETNSSYQSDKMPNTIAVMDIPVGKLASNAKAMELLSSDDPKAPAKLREMGVAGVRIEDPEKVIKVKFK